MFREIFGAWDIFSCLFFFLIDIYFHGGAVLRLPKKKKNLQSQREDKNEGVVEEEHQDEEKNEAPVTEKELQQEKSCEAPIPK